jgi:hypothetical protein
MGRGTQVPWTNPEIQKLSEAWRDGEELDVICIRFGRTAAAVRTQLSAAGVKRTPEKLSQLRRDIVNRHWREVKG